MKLAYGRNSDGGMYVADRGTFYTVHYRAAHGMRVDLLGVFGNLDEAIEYVEEQKARRKAL